MCNMKALSLSVLKLMSRFSFFKSRSKLKVKVKDQNFGTNRKVLPSGISIRNMEALSQLVQKLTATLSFLLTDRWMDRQGDFFYPPPSKKK